MPSNHSSWPITHLAQSWCHFPWSGQDMLTAVGFVSCAAAARWLHCTITAFCREAQLHPRLAWCIQTIQLLFPPTSQDGLWWTEEPEDVVQEKVSSTTFTVCRLRILKTLSARPALFTPLLFYYYLLHCTGTCVTVVVARPKNKSFFFVFVFKFFPKSLALTFIRLFSQKIIPQCRFIFHSMLVINLCGNVQSLNF